MSSEEIKLIVPYWKPYPDNTFRLACPLCEKEDFLRVWRTMEANNPSKTLVRTAVCSPCAMSLKEGE